MCDVSKASVTRYNFSCNLCRNGVVRQVVGRLQRVTCPLCNLSLSFLRLATVAQNQLVLHGAICLVTCLTTLEKEIIASCRRHVTHAAVTSCNLQSIQNKFHAIVAEIRTELYFVQSLQALKKLRDELQRGHVTHCNLPATFLATPLQHESSFTREREQFYNFPQTFSSSEQILDIVFCMK